MTTDHPTATDVDNLREAIREELANLWADLDNAHRNALNGQWSIGCEDIAGRIEKLSRLVGPTPWQEVQIRLLENGVYQRLHAEWGIETPPVDMATLAEVRASIDAQLAKLKPHG